MFRSCEYLNYDIKANLYKYKITDSDFITVVETNLPVGGSGDLFLASVIVAVVKEYIKRNLSIVNNIILLCLYLEKFKYKMEDIIYWQDKFCHEYINNWAEIAAERDRLLDKLSAMK